MSSDAATLIKEHLKLSEFIGRYTRLVRKGNRLAACCPLHKEKTPSFYLDDNKGYYHCFGCGKGGDLINFCMEMEGLEFVDALEFLAETAGVELPKRGTRGPGRDVIEALRTINGEASNFYHQQFMRNKAAKAYLAERGISEGTARLFRLGYAPAQWDGLLNHLTGKFDPKLLQRSGLFKEGKKGNPYDLFRDRLMFPIRDVYGHTIAFGGRLFNGEEGPKYINSPESPLYVKGKHVYNLDFAKVFLKKKPEDGVLVVEGYMDVIQLYQAGVTNVIAGLGTAFTPEQGKLLKRFTKKVVINYDADNAGFKAARAAIEIFLALGLDISVITLPHKTDPDDFIKENGVDAYRERLAEGEEFFSYLLRYLGQGGDITSDPRFRSEVARELVKVVDRIEDPVVHQHYMEQTAQHLTVPGHVLEQLHEKKKETKRAPKKPATPQRSQPRRQAPPPPSAPPPTNEPMPFQYGDEPVPQQYGDEPMPQQYGNEPAPQQYGDFDEPPPPDFPDEPPPEMMEDMHFYDGMVEADLGVPTGPGPSQGKPEWGGERSWRGKRKPWKGKRGKGRYEDEDDGSAPGVAEIRPGMLNKLEEEFLFHVMHTDDFNAVLAEEHREILPRILANVFADRRWVLDFIYSKDHENFEQRLQLVPPRCQQVLAKINFTEEFTEESKERLGELCPDLLKAMLNKMARVNAQRIKGLPPGEVERKKALMRTNTELMRQASRL